MTRAMLLVGHARIGLFAQPPNDLLRATAVDGSRSMLAQREPRTERGKRGGEAAPQALLHVRRPHHMAA